MMQPESLHRRAPCNQRVRRRVEPSSMANSALEDYSRRLTGRGSVPAAYRRIVIRKCSHCVLRAREKPAGAFWPRAAVHGGTTPHRPILGPRSLKTIPFQSIGGGTNAKKRVPRSRLARGKILQITTPKKNGTFPGKLSRSGTAWKEMLCARKDGKAPPTYRWLPPERPSCRAIGRTCRRAWDARRRPNGGRSWPACRRTGSSVRAWGCWRLCVRRSPSRTRSRRR